MPRLVVLVAEPGAVLTTGQDDRAGSATHEFAEIGFAMRTEHGGEFVLVRREEAHARQPLDRQQLRGGGIENDGNAFVLRDAQRGVDRVEGNFQLDQHRIGTTNDVAGGLDLGGRDATVSGGHHDDAVLATGDRDRCRAAADPVNPRHVGHVDAFGHEAIVKLFAESVVADATDHRHRGTETRGGDRLVRALAAGDGEETVAGQRFARAGKARRERDQVHIDASDDDDSRHAL
ncbi:hypothetical protein Y886_33930 [Xanthomonas hyacinthi DSM 19077]|nr:hypothetical protein Y886_33930 [Xanthomonas hyacinthi DSM 19077]